MKSVLLLNTFLLVFFFIAWCVLDYALVKSPNYPQNAADADWVLLMIPILTVAANLIAQRKQSLTRLLVTSLVASLAVCLIFPAIVLGPGVLFHFSIGGTL
jgi:hypothetical protein